MLEMPQLEVLTLVKPAWYRHVSRVNYSSSPSSSSSSSSGDETNGAGEAAVSEAGDASGDHTKLAAAANAETQQNAMPDAATAPQPADADQDSEFEVDFDTVARLDLCGQAEISEVLRRAMREDYPGNSERIDGETCCPQILFAMPKARRA
jgi:hypothetical protein